MIKKIVQTVLSSVLIFSIVILPIQAEAESSNLEFYPRLYVPIEMENEEISFEEEVEVLYLENGDVVVRDFNGELSDGLLRNTNTRGIMWTLIGIVWKVTSGCGTIAYFSGHDLCRILLDSLKTPSNNVRYEVTGRFISGRIPGCTPMHSSACNTGYWEYRLVRE
ncbi:MAG: hypothetical protein ACK5LZ_05010 [Anaerorhabdus sp.]